MSFTVCLHFNDHLPGGTRLAGTRMSPFCILLELRVMEMVVTTGAIRRAKLQSNVTTNKPTPGFLGAMRSIEPNSYGNVAGWVAGWLSVTAGIVSKRLNLS